MKKYTANQKRVLLGTSLLMMAFALVHTSVGYFVAPVTESLGIQRSTFMLYYTIMQLVSIVTTPLFGRLITRVSIKKYLICGSIWGTLCFIGFSLIRDQWMLYFFSALLGVVVSGCTSLAAAVIINHCFGEQSGGPMGIVMAGTGICGILQGFLIPGLLAGVGWRAVYAILGVCWGAALLAAAFLNGDQQTTATQAAVPEQKSIEADTASAKWNAGLVLFLTCIFVFSLHGTFLHHMQAHFTEQGIPETVTGIFMSIFNVFVIAFKISQGYLFDRWGAKKTTATAFLVFAVGLLLATTQKPTLLFISMICLAFGMSAETVLPPLLTRDIWGNGAYAIIYARVTMAYNCGTAFGSPLWGAVYDATESYIVGLFCTPWTIMTDLILIFVLMRKKNVHDAA